MTKKRLALILGIIIILIQLVLFRDYIPLLSNPIVIKGMRYTCPDAQIESGAYYLKSITPDSLKKFKLDYSEIYFVNEISSFSDPMGVSQYIVYGEIVGKQSVSEGDEHYYPLFKIKKYKTTYFYNISKWIIRILLVIEIIILILNIKRKRVVTFLQK